MDGQARTELLRHALDTVFAPWMRDLDLALVEAGDGVAVLELPVAPRHVHGGGVLCGQTLMAACDTAMVLAVIAKLGAFKPMTTVQMQTSFLRPIPKSAGTAGSAARVTARVLKSGRSLVFGEVQVQAPNGDLAAHATATCALL